MIIFVSQEVFSEFLIHLRRMYINPYSMTWLWYVSLLAFRVEYSTLNFWHQAYPVNKFSSDNVLSIRLLSFVPSSPPTYPLSVSLTPASERKLLQLPEIIANERYTMVCTKDTHSCHVFRIRRRETFGIYKIIDKDRETNRILHMVCRFLVHSYLLLTRPT